MNISANTVKVRLYLDAQTAGNTFLHGCNIFFCECVEVLVTL